VYAIVRGGSRQHKVAVGDVIDIDQVAEADTDVTLEPVMLVDGDKVIIDGDVLGKATVTASVMGPVAGPKIRILKFKNKTGHIKRQGHRQKYTRVVVTDIKG